MKKLTFSDIVFNVIRFGLIAAIAGTVVFHFTTENAVTTITISDIGSSQAAAQNSARISETTASSAAKLININTATALPRGWQNSPDHRRRRTFRKRGTCGKRRNSRRNNSR